MLGSLLLVIVPLLAYTGYCSYTILGDRASTISKMQNNEADDASTDFQESFIDAHRKEQDPSLSYCSVRIGAQVDKISDIQPSNEYFSCAMHLWFDFSQSEFHTMYKSYKDPLQDAEADRATEEQKLQDVFTVNSSTNTVTYASDNIPDYIELLTPFSLKEKTDLVSSVYQKDQVIAANSQFAVVPQLWKEERLSYSGLHESTIYDSFSRNFDVGKGLDSSSLCYFYSPGGEAYGLGKKH